MMKYKERQCEWHLTIFLFCAIAAASTIDREATKTQKKKLWKVKITSRLSLDLYIFFACIVFIISSSMSYARVKWTRETQESFSRWNEIEWWIAFHVLLFKSCQYSHLLISSCWDLLPSLKQFRNTLFFWNILSMKSQSIEGRWRKFDY